MEKIKPIDHIYTLEEITEIVDKKYPYEAYELKPIGETTKQIRRFGDEEVEVDVTPMALVNPFNSPRPDFVEEKGYVIELFLQLNELNRVLIGVGLTPDSKEGMDKVRTDRENTYYQIQDYLTPIIPIRGTQREKRAFQRAINDGLMERTDNGYKWLETKAELAYFVFLLYNSSKGGVPFKQIEKLFNEKRMDRAVNAVNNATTQAVWRVKIESLLKEG